MQHHPKAAAVPRKPQRRRALASLLAAGALGVLGAGCGGGGDDAPAPAAVAPRTCNEGNGPAIGGLDISGATSFSGLSRTPGTSGTMLFDPGEVTFANSALPAGTASGNLRVTLWATATNYTGGTLTGQIVARTPLVFTGGVQRLGNGQRADVAAATISATSPSRGSYCIVVTLEEQDAARCSSPDGYCIVDWAQFGGSSEFQ